VSALRARRFTALLRSRRAGRRGSLLCRTRFIGDAVTGAVRRGLNAVVLLGAGLDTRAERLDALATARVFELDLPEVQQFKRKRLGRLGPNVLFAATDFNAEALDAALKRF
jgi:methyltransferase (TIGR00027 family)